MKKVLIVEDNELNLKLFRDLLLIKNYNIAISRNGLDIINVVLQEEPNLIIMDIYLNEILGTDLIRELKANQNTKNIPIIAITACALSKDKSEILESGCDMYMSKPVSIDNFFKAVDKFINNVNNI